MIYTHAALFSGLLRGAPRGLVFTKHNWLLPGSENRARSDPPAGIKETTAEYLPFSVNQGLHKDAVKSGVKDIPVLRESVVLTPKRMDWT